MFIIVLFIVAKMWKEPKVPSIDEYVVKENVVYIHTREEQSTLKRSEVSDTCYNMDKALITLC